MHPEIAYRDAKVYMDETSETSLLNVMTLILEHMQSFSAERNSLRNGFGAFNASHFP